jgi:diguanylate cyclase (GGDEF)-like protein
VFQTLRDGERREVEEMFIHSSGQRVPVHLTVTPMLENGQLVGAEVVFQDISLRKAMEQELQRLATTDSLTGLPNRRHFMEQLEYELARIKRFGKPASLLMLDLDHFKRVNDTYGHAAGDAVLRHFAELAQTSLREIDLIGRLGGEEFGVLLPGTTQPGAIELAERLREAVAAAPVMAGEHQIPVTVSIGIAEFDPTDPHPDDILARADVALYKAKESGRNRVCPQ